MIKYIRYAIPVFFLLSFEVWSEGAVFFSCQQAKQIDDDSNKQLNKTEIKNRVQDFRDLNHWLTDDLTGYTGTNLERLKVNATYQVSGTKHAQAEMSDTLQYFPAMTDQSKIAVFEVLSMLDTPIYHWEPLLDCLSSSDVSVRSCAASVLTNIHPSVDQSIPKILKQLPKHSGKTRNQLILTLSIVGQHSRRYKSIVVDELNRIAQNPKESISTRSTAIYRLYDMEIDKGKMKDILVQVGNTEPKLRFECVSILLRVAPESQKTKLWYKELKKSDLHVLLYDIGKLGIHADPFIPSVIKGLDDKSFLNQIQSAFVLCKIGRKGSKEAKAKLLSLVLNGSESESWRTALVFPRCGIVPNKNSLPKLLRKMKASTTPTVYLDILSSMKESAREAIPTLQKMLRAEDYPHMKLEIASTISIIDKKREAKNDIVNLLSDLNNYPRCRIEELIAIARRYDCIEIVLKSAKTMLKNPSSRLVGLETLYLSGADSKRAAKEVTSLLQDKDPFVKVWALLVCEKINKFDDKQKKEIIGLTKDSHLLVRWQATEVVNRMKWK